MVPVNPMPPTLVNRTLVGAAGFVVGVVLQILFAALVNTIVGSVPNLLSPRMLLWAAILLAPPILSYKYLVIAPGSMAEYFTRGVQTGALFWFVVILVKLLA